MRAPVAATVVLFLGLAASCGAARGQIVPPVAPDSVPADLHDLANYVDRGAGALISTSILFVLFERDAAQADRQAAVESIGGTVVGGSRAGADGIYLVRVPGDGTLETIFAVAESLESLPAVTIAAPFWAGGIVAN